MLPLWLASPLVRKLLVYGAIMLVAFLSFRWWLNRHDAIVYQEGKQSVTEEQRKRAEETIKLERENLAKEKQALTLVIEQLQSQMDKLHGNLNEAIKQSKKTQASNPTIVLSIPDSDLPGAIRTELKRTTNQR